MRTSPSVRRSPRSASASKLAIESASGGRAPVVLGLGVAAYPGSLSAIQAAAPRGLATGAVRARAVLVLAALAVGVFGSGLSPALAVALMAAGVAALAASGR